ncbi:MAG: tyrosine-protein kinase domain-containing protein [Acidimicrobiales bacterium]
MQATESLEQQDLRAYLRLLNRRRITIIVTTLVVLGLALAYTFVKTPIYTASAQVLVPPQTVLSPLSSTNGQAAAPALSSQQALADAQQFALGDATKKLARSDLHFAPHVSVTSSTTADVLTFAASSTARSQAATIANTYAKAFITAERDNQVAQYTEEVAAIETSVTKIQAKEAALPPGSPQLAADQQSVTNLTQSVQTLQAGVQLATQGGPSLINAAVTPSAPSSPKPLTDGLLGLVVGLMLGVGLAFVRERLDDKIGSLSDAERYAGGVPVVGTVPLVDDWRDEHQTHVALVEDPTSLVSEAYRTLRTAVQFLGIDQPQRVIALTSSLPGEGKSTTVANLAVSFARAGRHVVVLSCDFRRPRMHEFFGLDNNVGMTSVLLGEVSLRDAIRSIEAEPNLQVLASGPIPPNPAEILSLDRARKLVDVLAENADIVLVDCPPVLPVTDTLLISRLVDGVLVLTAATRTKKHDLQRTCDLLRQVGAPIMGTVVNRVPHNGAYATNYGYGYSYSYSYDLPEAEVVATNGKGAVRSRQTPATPSGGAGHSGHGSLADRPPSDLRLGPESEQAVAEASNNRARTAGGLERRRVDPAPKEATRRGRTGGQSSGRYETDRPDHGPN